MLQIKDVYLAKYLINTGEKVALNKKYSLKELKNHFLLRGTGSAFDENEQVL